MFEYLSDYLKAYQKEAQAICDAAGTDVDATVSLYAGERGVQFAIGHELTISVSEPTADAALARFAEKLGVAYPLPQATAPAVAPVVYASSAQKEEIIRLLNHPVITRQEKTKVLLNINRLDEERATAMITKLKTAIQQRETQPLKQVA